MQPSPRLAARRHVLFTITLLQRRKNALLTREIDLLRALGAGIRHRHPFYIRAQLQADLDNGLQPIVASFQEQGQ